MKPIGPLMWEHRLIERMVQILKTEIGRIRGQNEISMVLIDQAVDFFRTYSDRTHFDDVGQPPLAFAQRLMHPLAFRRVPEQPPETVGLPSASDIREAEPATVLLVPSFLITSQSKSIWGTRVL